MTAAKTKYNLHVTITKENEMKVTNSVQHGEVFIQTINKLPKGDYAKATSFIVAHSETGHHHVLESKTAFETMGDIDKNDLYIRLFEPAKLVHKKVSNKHRTLELAPGLYKVWHKSEYSPFTKLVSRVKD